MSIPASLVMELRKRTGAAMMDCKRALVECNGEIEAAATALRKADKAKADKKADRIAAEGLVVIKSSQNQAVILEANCETDFVARDENFVNFTNQVAQIALDNQIAEMDILSNTAYDDSQTVEEARKTLISKIGENVQLRRFFYLQSDNLIVSYTHGTKIAVLVELAGGDETLGKDIAMHIAAASPIVIVPSDVPTDLVEKEKEIFHAQAQDSGKPAEIIEKMLTGRVNKFLNEMCLEGQAFVKEPSTTVGQLLKSAKASVKSFKRFEVGEGIEKKEEDFVAEVMAQAKKES